MKNPEDSRKKLYVVEVVHRAYVYAESEKDALQFSSKVKDTEVGIPDARPVTSNVLNWPLSCLVYHSGATDLALADVLPSPQKPKGDPSARLTREQVDSLLEKLRDPALAKNFLMEAGLIDADGDLAPPYRTPDDPTFTTIPGGWI